MHDLVALEASLAHEWQRRGLALVKRSALGESAISAKAVNERSTDEIAILYTNAVIYGLGTGLAFAVVAQTNSTAGVVLPMLLFGGASAGAVALLDSGRPLRYGVPQSIVSGMYVGLEEGLALSLWGSQSSAQWSGQTVAGVTWGLTTVGAVAGGVLGATVGTTPGRASFVGTTSLWGGALSAVTVEALNTTGDATGPLLAASVGVGSGRDRRPPRGGPGVPFDRARSLPRPRRRRRRARRGGFTCPRRTATRTRVASGISAVGIAAGLVTAWAATSGMAADRVEPTEKPERSAFSWSPSMIPAKEGMMVGVSGTL